MHLDKGEDLAVPGLISEMTSLKVDEIRMFKVKRTAPGLSSQQMGLSGLDYFNTGIKI